MNYSIKYHGSASFLIILLTDPDIIMVGEIRDELTAQICLTCALTGHLVLTTIHSSNAYLTLKRLMNLSFSSSCIKLMSLCGLILEQIDNADSKS